MHSRQAGGELPAGYPHAAAPVTGTDKAGVVDIALIGGQHQRADPVGVPVGVRPLAASGQAQQRQH